MKLVSAKQKMTTTGSSERINFCNEIEHIPVSEDSIYRLSDFNSDIICFDVSKNKNSVTICILCNRPYRKYTFIAHNRMTETNVIFDFQGARGGSINKYSNEPAPVFKADTIGIIDLYQTSDTSIRLVQHTLNSI